MGASSAATRRPGAQNLLIGKHDDKERHRVAFWQSNRKLCGRQYLLEHHERTDLPNTGKVEKLLGVQPIAALGVLGANEQEVVELARDDVAFHAAGDTLGCLLEVSERIGCRTVEHNAD